MAFSNRVLRAGVKSDGTAYEYGTFDAASVTTGNVTAGGGTNFPANTPKVGLIMNWALASDGDSAALTCARDAGDAVLKITCASSDTGTYYIEGPTTGS